MWNKKELESITSFYNAYGPKPKKIKKINVKNFKKCFFYEALKEYAKSRAILKVEELNDFIYGPELLWSINAELTEPMKEKLAGMN